jgi:hypothetical protein
MSGADFGLPKQWLFLVQTFYYRMVREIDNHIFPTAQLAPTTRPCLKQRFKHTRNMKQPEGNSRAPMCLLFRFVALHIGCGMTRLVSAPLSGRSTCQPLGRRWNIIGAQDLEDKSPVA